MAVLCGIHGVREVRVTRRKPAVKDFAAEKVVLGVALAVAEGKHPVRSLMKAHHDAGLVDIFRVVNGIDVHVPADFALGVNDGVLRIVVPFESAAHRVIPDDTGEFPARGKEVIDEVEAVGEFRCDLLYFGLKHILVLGLRAVDFGVDRGSVGAVDLFFNALRFLAVNNGVGDFDGVHVVRIQTENGNAGVGAKRRVAYVILDFLTALFGNDAHRGVL